MASKSFKLPKRTLTFAKQKRRDGRGSKYSVGSYRRVGTGKKKN